MTTTWIKALSSLFHTEDTHQKTPGPTRCLETTKKPVSRNTKNREKVFRRPLDQQHRTIGSRSQDNNSSCRQKKREIFPQKTIVPVKVAGEFVHLRAILDSSTLINLITGAAVQKFQLKRKKKKQSRFGRGRNEVSTYCEYVAICLQSKSSKATNSVESLLLTKKIKNFPFRYVNPNS